MSFSFPNPAGSVVDSGGLCYVYRPETPMARLSRSSQPPESPGMPEGPSCPAVPALASEGTGRHALSQCMAPLGRWHGLTRGGDGLVLSY